MQNKIDRYRAELNNCFKELNEKQMEHVVMQLSKRGRTIFILGNGGSALTASHMALDLNKWSRVKDFPNLRAISLTDSVGSITAWANDVSSVSIFKEQLANLMRPGDLVIGISASGNSPNVLTAISYAKENGATTIGLIGFGGGDLKDIVDAAIVSSSTNYGVVEDFHMSLGHILAQFIKEHRERDERWAEASY
jgi:D-sedoheptulose 7-phosphate isomerase